MWDNELIAGDRAGVSLELWDIATPLFERPTRLTLSGSLLGCRLSPDERTLFCIDGRNDGASALPFAPYGSVVSSSADDTTSVRATYVSQPNQLRREDPTIQGQRAQRAGAQRLESMLQWKLTRGIPRLEEPIGFDGTGKVFFGRNRMPGASRTSDGLTIWDVKSGEVSRRFDSIRLAGVSDDRRFLAYSSGTVEGSSELPGLKVLDVVEDRELLRIPCVERDCYYTNAFFAPENKYLVAISGDGAVQITKPVGEADVVTCPRHHLSTIAPVFSNDGERMLMHMGGRRVDTIEQTSWAVVSLATGKVIAEMPYGQVSESGFPNRNDDMAQLPTFTPDLKTIVFAKGRVNKEQRGNSTGWLSKTWSATIWMPESNETFDIGEWISPPSDAPPKLDVSIDGRRLVADWKASGLELRHRDRRQLELWDLEKRSRLFHTSGIEGELERADVLSAVGTLAITITSTRDRKTENHGFVLLSLESGKPITSHRGRTLAYPNDPTGHRLILSPGQSGKTCSIIDARTGKVIWEYEQVYGESVTFSRDGSKLIRRSRDRSSTKVIDTNSGEASEFPTSRVTVTNLGIIVQGDENSLDELHVQNPEDGSPTRTVSVHWGPHLVGGRLTISDFAMSPNGTHLAFRANGQPRLAGIEDGRVHAASIRPGHLGYVLDVDVTPDGGVLVTGGDDATVGFWDGGNGEYRGQIDGFQSSVNSVMFDREANRLLILDASGLLSCWDIHIGDSDSSRLIDATLQWKVSVPANSRMTRNRDLDSFLVHSDSGDLCLINRLDGSTVRQTTAPESIRDAEWIPDLGLVVATESSKLLLGDFDRNKAWTTIAQGVSTIALSADRHRMVTGGIRVQLWNITDTLIPMMFLDERDEGASFVEVSESGRVLVVTAARDQIVISDTLAMQEEIEKLELFGKHTGPSGEMTTGHARVDRASPATSTRAGVTTVTETPDTEAASGLQDVGSIEPAFNGADAGTDIKRGSTAGSSGVETSQATQLQSTEPSSAPALSPGEEAASREAFTKLKDLGVPILYSDIDMLLKNSAQPFGGPGPQHSSIPRPEEPSQPRQSQGAPTLAAFVILDDPQLTDDGAIVDEVWRALRKLSNLKAISCIPSKRNLAEEGIRQLSELTQLEVLGIGMHGITDSQFGRLKSLKGLRVLNLMFCNLITDETLQHVSSFERLEHLDILGDFGMSFESGEVVLTTKVTDQGLRHLEKLQSLQTLRLSSFNTSDAGIAQLNKSLPRCLIEHLPISDFLAEDSSPPSRQVAPDRLENDAERAIAEYDKNGDGTISSEEIPGMPGIQREVVVSADLDGDGEITKTEVLQRMKQEERRVMMEQDPDAFAELALAQFDVNGDGVITKDESGLPEEIFDAGDYDSDGKITKSELLKQIGE